jgi:hypothetical protein
MKHQIAKEGRTDSATTNKHIKRKMSTSTTTNEQCTLNSSSGECLPVRPSMWVCDRRNEVRPKNETITRTDGNGQDMEQQYTFGTPKRNGSCTDWEWTLITMIDEAFQIRELDIKKGTVKLLLISATINRNKKQQESYLIQNQVNSNMVPIKGLRSPQYISNDLVKQRFEQHWPESMYGQIPTVAQLFAHFGPEEHISATYSKQSVRDHSIACNDPETTKRAEPNKHNLGYIFKTPFRRGHFEDWEVKLLRVIDGMFDNELMGLVPGTQKKRSWVLPSTGT